MRKRFIDTDNDTAKKIGLAAFGTLFLGSILAGGRHAVRTALKRGIAGGVAGYGLGYAGTKGFEFYINRQIQSRVRLFERKQIHHDNMNNGANYFDTMPNDNESIVKQKN